MLFRSVQNGQTGVLVVLKGEIAFGGGIVRVFRGHADCSRRLLTFLDSRCFGNQESRNDPNRNLTSNQVDRQWQVDGILRELKKIL